MTMGIINLPPTHKWAPLSFGWTLKDVIQSGMSVKKADRPATPILEQTFAEADSKGFSSKGKSSTPPLLGKALKMVATGVIYWYFKNINIRMKSLFSSD